MTSIDNFEDSDGQPVQPYFAAYMIEHGHLSTAEALRAGGWRYIHWINARWNEFGAERRIPEHLRNLYSHEFKAWLAERVSAAVEAVAA